MHGKQPGIEFINPESTSSHEQYSIDIYNTKNYKAVNTYEQVFWFPVR